MGGHGGLHRRPGDGVRQARHRRAGAVRGRVGQRRGVRQRPRRHDLRGRPGTAAEPQLDAGRRSVHLAVRQPGDRGHLRPVPGRVATRRRARHLVRDAVDQRAARDEGARPAARALADGLLVHLPSHDAAAQRHAHVRRPDDGVGLHEVPRPWQQGLSLAEPPAPRACGRGAPGRGGEAPRAGQAAGPAGHDRRHGRTQGLPAACDSSGPRCGSPPRRSCARHTWPTA